MRKNIVKLFLGPLNEVASQLHRINMGKHLWFKFSIELILIIQFGFRISFTRRIILRTVNLHLNPLDTSQWQNSGFEKVTRNIGDLKQGNAPAPTAFFMASKTARLVTHMINFDGDSLYINFSSMIGKSVNQKSSTTTPSTTTITTPPIVVMKLDVPPLTEIGILESQPNQAIEPLLSIAESANSTNSHTSSIIQISLDPSNPALKTEIHKIMRKKRELDSKDILQIHQMIKSANNANITLNASSPIMTPSASETIVESATREIPNAEIRVLIPDSKPKIENVNIGQAYKNWRTSTISKNARPPGFYLTINDEVVFDNWGGVWNNIPNVIGKWNSNPQAHISNRTHILYTWDNIHPNRAVKVSFEWEPVDSSMFLFLDDISISTYEAGDPDSKKSTDDINNKIPSALTDAGNKNITIYIVVKSEAGDTTTRHTESISSNTSEMTTMIVETNTTIPKLINSGRVRNDINKNNYPVIVLAVLGCSFLVILVFILWIKINGGKRCAGIPC